MKRFFNNSDNHDDDDDDEGFDFESEFEDDDDDDDDDDNMDIPESYLLPQSGYTVPKEILEREYNQDLMKEAERLARQHWLWRFRSIATKLKMIQEAYLGLSELLKPKEPEKPEEPKEE